MIRKMDRQALIFLHIPKTAGTTLNQIIEGQCGPLSIFTLDLYRIRATAKRFKMLSEQHRPRFGGGVLVLVFYLAQAASLAPPQIEKRAVGSRRLSQANLSSPALSVSIGHWSRGDRDRRRTVTGHC